MRKQTLCFLVIGTSLAMLLQNLARRRALAPARPMRAGEGAEVVDLAAWKELRNRQELSFSAR